MATNYLLPCQCGKKTEVDSSQAGLSVRCQCGTELAVPTMRGLASLERVETAPRAAAPPLAAAWGPRQGMIFFGSTVLVVAALAAFFFWWQMPNPPMLNENYQEFNRAFIDQRSPEELFDIWHDLQTGIAQPMWETQLDAYDRTIGEQMQREMVAGGLAAVGLIIVVIGLMIRPGGLHRQAAMAPAHAGR